MLEPRGGVGTHMTKIEGSASRAPATHSSGVGSTPRPDDAGVPSLDELAPNDERSITSADVATAATVTGGMVGTGMVAAQNLTFARELADGTVALAKSEAAFLAKSSKLASQAGTALNLVGATAVALDKVENSTAETTLGRAVDATASGGLAYVLGANPATGAFLAVDAVLEKAVEAGVQHVAGEEVNAKVGVGTLLNSSVTATVTLAEGVATGDDKGAKEFSDKAAKGEYGVLMQAANWLGDNVFDATVAYDYYFGD